MKETLGVREYKLTAELFVISHKGRFIIYAPLKRLALLVNKDAVQLLHQIKQGNLNALTPAVLTTIQTFIDLGLINGSEDVLPVVQDQQDHYAPTQVTLLLTTDCNLRCVYCYANGGDSQTYLKWKWAKAAIDFVVDNTLAKGRDHFFVGFHGAGEPTMNWPIFTKVTLYAREMAKQHGLKVRISSATNAIMNDKKVDWIATHLDSVNISFDGPIDLQNLQRPTPNQKSSFDRAVATMKRFDELGFPYGLRVTVTPEGVRRMAEIVEFLLTNFKTKDLHMEPLFVSGRCLTTDWKSPLAMDFICGFREGQKVAREYCMDLFYSGARLDTITNNFCGATEDNFVVTPDGHVSACYEVSDLQDPRADIFVFGTYDDRVGKFVIDEAKWAYLRRHSVEEVEHCTDCFAKWHCAGDCLARRVMVGQELKDTGETSRCKINQELIKDQILQLMGEDPYEDIELMTLLHADRSKLGEQNIPVPSQSLDKTSVVDVPFHYPTSSTIWKSEARLLGW